jgi:DNA polymerase III subunit delta
VIAGGLLEDKPVVYILHGDDPQAMDQFVDAMVAKMGDPGLADLNTARLDARNASDEDIRTAASSIPFLADRRLVVLLHPSDKVRKAAAERFLAFLDSLPSTTALVLIQEDNQRYNSKSHAYEWDTFSDTHALMLWARKVGKRAFVKDFRLPRQQEMPAWISKTARERGGQFTPQAAQELASLIGTDTRVALLEIDKLLTYVDHQRAVEVEDVADCTAAINQMNVYELTDALSAGDRTSALRLLRGLLEEQDAIPLFATLAGHFRSLLIAREILSEGGDLSAIMAELSRPKFVVDKMMTQAQRYSLPGLERIYLRLAQMDIEMKSGVMTGDLSLEMFIAGIKVE